MKKVFKASITFKVDEGHPDYKHVKNPSESLTFNDTYTLDTDFFNDEKSIINTIKNDLALVAGGGYSRENIHDVAFNIERIK